MSATATLMTAEELLRLPRGQFRYELIDGELKQMSPAGHNHGRIAMRLSIPLGQYVQEHNLGEVYAADTGFKLKSKPDTVRAPDLSFIEQRRVDRGVTIYRSRNDIQILTENDFLSGGTVVPGFSYPIANLFALRAKEQ